jgi:mitochondrial import inner membrane translocase subunit TIM23
VLASISTFMGCFAVLSSTPDLTDKITKILLPDPFISMGLVTFGAALLGWLIGPIFGNGLWRLLHRARLLEFTVKERTFFERIKKHRVNPEGASTNNPVPDYYGEKIGSVSGYRRWLKDQRAFNRKRAGNFLR